MCNRRCPYCDIPNIQNKYICDYDIFKYWVNKCSKSYNNVVITGGEPGYLPRNYYNFLYNIDNLKININTNGYWFKRYSNFINCTNLIVYHASEEIKENLDFKEIVREEENINYAFLLHHQNIDKLKPMIINNLSLFKKNENKLIFYFYDNKQNFANDVYNLTDKDLEDIYIILNTYLPSNKSVEFLKKIIMYKNFIKISRRLCNKYCLFPAIDLVNKTIKNCPNSYTNVPGNELTEENLDLLNNNKLYCFEGKNKLCDSCYNFIYKIDYILDMYLRGCR